MLVSRDKTSINIQTENRRWTPLHLACSRGYYDICKYLVAEGANFDCISADGLTPMGKLMRSSLA